MALTFLTDDDIRTNIRNEFFAFLTDANPAADQLIIDLAEKSAIQKMKSKLAGRYDVDAIFSAVAPNRNELVVEHCLDLFLHRLHCRINPRKVPDIIKAKYNEALDWLDGVMKGEENPILPPLPAPENGVNDLRYGSSNTPKKHYY